MSKNKKETILEATLVEDANREDKKEIKELELISDMDMVKKDIFELIKHQRQQNKDLTDFSKKIEEKIETKLDDFSPGQLISLYTAINKDRTNIAKNLFEMLKPTNQDGGVIGKILIGKDESDKNVNPSDLGTSKEQNDLYNALLTLSQSVKQKDDKDKKTENKSNNKEEE